MMQSFYMHVFLISLFSLAISSPVPDNDGSLRLNGTVCIPDEFGKICNLTDIYCNGLDNSIISNGCNLPYYNCVDTLCNLKLCNITYDDFITKNKTICVPRSVPTQISRVPDSSSKAQLISESEQELLEIGNQKKGITGDDPPVEGSGDFTSDPTLTEFEGSGEGSGDDNLESFNTEATTTLEAITTPELSTPETPSESTTTKTSEPIAGKNESDTNTGDINKDELPNNKTNHEIDDGKPKNVTELNDDTLKKVGTDASDSKNETDDTNDNDKSSNPVIGKDEPPKPEESESHKAPESDSKNKTIDEINTPSNKTSSEAIGDVETPSNKTIDEITSSNKTTSEIINEDSNKIIGEAIGESDTSSDKPIGDVVINETNTPSNKTIISEDINESDGSIPFFTWLGAFLRQGFAKTVENQDNHTETTTTTTTTSTPFINFENTSTSKKGAVEFSSNFTESQASSKENNSKESQASSKENNFKESPQKSSKENDLTELQKSSKENNFTELQKSNKENNSKESQKSSKENSSNESQKSSKENNSKESQKSSKENNSKESQQSSKENKSIKSQKLIKETNLKKSLASYNGTNLSQESGSPELNETSTNTPVSNKTSTDYPELNETYTNAPVSNKTSTDDPVSTSTDDPELNETSTNSPVSNKTSTDNPVSNKTFTPAPPKPVKLFVTYNITINETDTIDSENMLLSTLTQWYKSNDATRHSYHFTNFIIIFLFTKILTHF